MRKVLIRPILTEKMNNVSEKEGKYGFMVDVKANKIEITKAVKDKFNLDVIHVNTIRYRGKRITQFTKKGRFEGKKPQYKKAIIKLKEGQTIDLYKEV